MFLNRLLVHRKLSIREALEVMETSGFGILLLIDQNEVFERTITDGDLRRLILAGFNLDATLENLPQIKSVSVSENYKKKDVFDLMNQFSINHIPVIDACGKVIDVLNRKDFDHHILLSVPHMGDDEKYFVDEAFETNWIAPLGPNVDAFEAELADAVQIRHALAVSSGTAAIHLALRVLGVNLGDRVFCSTLTFAASAFPIVYQGADPIFIDSDKESWNMSPKALERAFEKSKLENWLPKAVIVVNLYGQSADMDLILDICNRYNVPVIEDAAESLGAKYKGKSSGTFGKIGCYSFNGNKIITTSGGGMIVSNDRSLIEKAKFLSTQARDPFLHYQHSEIGYNYRMSNILAGVGRGQLKVLNNRVLQRRKIFEYYKDRLSDIHFLKFMPEPKWSYSNHWLSAITVDKNSPIKSIELIAHLSNEMIEARPVWKPMHLQPVFSKSRYFTADDVSISDDLFLNGICLPSSSNMTNNDLEMVVQSIRKIFGVK